MAAETAAWVCYLLRCADGTLYCGITNDLERRLAMHNAGEGAKYTRGRTPVRLAYAEPCPDKSTALRRERAIKRLPRAEKLGMCAAWGASAAAGGGRQGAPDERRGARRGAGLTQRGERR